MWRESSMGLSGKIAIVTGGAAGIGKTLSEALAAAGATVAVADIAADAAGATAAEISARDDVCGAGGEAAGFAVDVTDKESVTAMVQAVAEQLGGPDILVNNAGIFPISPVAAMKEQDWDRVMAVNMKGVFLCSQAVLEPMRKRAGGRIINLASVSGLVGAVGFAHYAASKAGVIGFTKSLAREVAATGITVNAVAPGIIGTETARKAFPEAALQLYTSQVPMRRLGEPEDLSAVVVFLASSGAGYITGQTYTVDGGYTMQ
jgi:3-oxoacyl-[acyl-carrier protein] reductase